MSIKTVQGEPVARNTQPDTLRPSSGSRRGLVLRLGLALASIGVLIGITYLELPRELKGLAVLALALVLVFIKVPAGAAMGLAGLVGIYVIAGTQPTIGALSDLPYMNAASVTLSVLPMFILMGLLLWRSGITAEMYTTARQWLRWLPGGLAVTTNVAGAGLGAASGSTIGITYAVGRIGIPEMIKSGYDRRLALGSVISAGTIGQLIPPSILLVVYAGFAELPVGPQLLSGILPGIVLTLTYAAVAITIGAMRPAMAPRGERVTIPWRDRGVGLLRLWPIIGIIVLVVGGMGAGLFTATEAGAVGALAALIYTWHRLGLRRGLEATRTALRDTLVSVGSIMFLLLGAAFLNRVLALSGAAQWFADWVNGSDLTGVTFLLLLIPVYLILGAFMDPIAMMLLTLPVLLPTAVSLGVNPITFGVFVVLLGEIAIMTPPIGMQIFLVHRLSQDPAVNQGQRVTLGDTIQASLWFVPGALATVLLVVFFPQLSEWIPATFGGGQ